jgi:hypothetical protein
MGGDEYHPQRMAAGLPGRGLGGQHHGYVNIAREVGQPLGMTWIGKACEMKRVLVGWGSDNGVDFAVKRQLYG